MAKRRTTAKELPDAVREAVDRTVQVTRGSAVQTRDRAQGAVGDLVETVDDLVKEAEGRIGRGRRAAARAIDDVRPVTNEDMRELKAELRRISRRLEAIEERLPAKRSGAKGGGGSSKARSGKGGGSSKAPSAKRGGGSSKARSAKRGSSSPR